MSPLEGGECSIADCRFSDNAAQFTGGAVELLYPSEDGGTSVAVTIDGVEFTGNTAPEGAAINWSDMDHLGNSTSLTITDSLFQGNGDLGQAALEIGTDMTIAASRLQGTTFADNSTGVLIRAADMTLDVEDCSFSGHDGYAFTAVTGGIAEVDFSASVFEDNRYALICATGSFDTFTMTIDGGSVLGSSEAGAVVASDGCTLESVSVDWDDSTSAQPVDVDTTAHQYSDYGSNASFTCQGEGECS
jgi:hypothetical protein